MAVSVERHALALARIFSLFAVHLTVLVLGSWFLEVEGCLLLAFCFCCLLFLLGERAGCFRPLAMARDEKERNMYILHTK